MSVIIVIINSDCLDKTEHDTETLICSSCRLPVLRTNDRETHLTFLIDVRMVYHGLKCYLRRFKRIFGWKIYFDAECSFVVRRTFLKRSTGSQISERSSLARQQIINQKFLSTQSKQELHFEMTEKRTDWDDQSHPLQNVRFVNIDVTKDLQVGRTNILKFLTDKSTIN